MENHKGEGALAVRPLVKLLFRLDPDDWHASASETLWAEFGEVDIRLNVYVEQEGFTNIEFREYGDVL